MITLTCHNCGYQHEFNDRVQHSATCEKCASYLKCCLNCRFYDPKAYNECLEFSADRVKEKEKANFCDFFESSSNAYRQASTRKDESLKKLNDLFKKK